MQVLMPKPRKLLLFLIFFLSKLLFVYMYFVFKSKNNIEGAASGNSSSQKIVNGQPARDGEFPFLASIFIFNSHTCGCTILDQQWVLTAAKYVTSDYKILAGSTNWPSGEEHQAVDRVIYPNYVNSATQNWPHNVALLRVSPPFEFSDLIQPVVIAKPDSDQTNLALIGQIAGWGTTTSGGLLVDDLLKADVLTLSEEDCETQLPGIANNLTMCAGGGGTGICIGDTGGPLLVDEVQVGITSWYPGVCAEGPAIFTRVSKYYDWISTEINKRNIS